MIDRLTNRVWRGYCLWRSSSAILRTVVGLVLFAQAITWAVRLAASVAVTSWGGALNSSAAANGDISFNLEASRGP